jgi:hypothetical protein
MLASRWQVFSSSIFSKMSQMAAAHQAVNLAQGFPDFDGPAVIKEAAIQAIRGNFNQYAPSTGLGELRRQLAKRQVELYGLSYDFASEVTVFSGATEAIFCCIMGLCGPGDEVLTFEPFFDCYPAATAMAGAVMKTVPLRAPDWSFSLDDLRAAVTSRTKVQKWAWPACLFRTFIWMRKRRAAICVLCALHFARKWRRWRKPAAGSRNVCRAPWPNALSRTSAFWPLQTGMGYRDFPLILKLPLDLDLVLSVRPQGMELAS